MNRPATAAPAAFWCRVPSRPNFGDALTPWLIERLGGRTPRFVPHDHPGPRLMVTGSIAGLAGPGATVWGAGLMWRNEALSPHARWLAVRGPLTRAQVLASGGCCPAVWGDPALLLPRLHVPPAGPRRGIGFVPHFSDRARLPVGWAEAQGLRLVDLQTGIEPVIDAIATCEWVVSTSLHGLIVAHAYGVPAVWAQLRDLPSGDGVKFADHFAALDAEPRAPLPIRFDGLADLALFERAAWAPARVDTEALWRSRPFEGADAGAARERRTADDA
jgi:hypothetical protein